MSSCETCGKEFVKRGGLARHKAKKIPCKKPTRLIANVVHQTLTEASMNHLEVPTTEFRDNSLQFHKSLSKEERGEQGIFFTPKKVRDTLFSELSSLGVSPKIVLEPSFGSGEFLLDAKRIWPSAKIIGVEKNEKLFKSVKCPGAELICDDFLNWSGSADLVIGNPPYFVIPTDSMSTVEKKAFSKANAVCMTGRPNIYVRFLYNCLELLVVDGFLAFILPTSIFN
jgi:type I restriction-modification system DNA methylase subunit